MSWVVEHLHRDGTVLARIAVSGSVFRIGRDLGNDLVLDDPHVAAHHAELHIAADGSAQLQDLGTRNGIHPHRGKREPSYAVQADAPFRLGSSQIRIRNRALTLPPEVALSMRAMWPLAVLALILVLGRGAWDIWLTDLRDKPPSYVYELTAMAVALCVWSAMYALLGRLLSGVDRFFTHLLIACSAFLGATVLHILLQLLSFSASWLWPMRIAPYATVVIVALTVRAHLRVADPRHWPVLRWGVATVAALAIVVPVAQVWITHHRLTNVQVLGAIEHPSLRLASPVGIPAFVDTTLELKVKADKARANNGDDNSGLDDGDSD
jgi:hypothetical protein